MGRLDQQVAVVTGAGREHALLLAAEGAAVVVNDLGGAQDGTGVAVGPAEEVAAQIRAGGGRAVANGDDVSDAAAAQRIVDAAVAEFGRLDVVVNNAGILRDRMLVNLTEDDWDLVVRVNLRGTFLMTRAAANLWRARSKAGDQVRAAVINTSSESGVFGNPGQANYAAAKAAVASLTQVAAKELGRYGVRVNAILPQARTRLTEGAFGAAFAGDGDFDRWDPANVSPFVAYLASPVCELSGEVFVVGGSKVQRVRGWERDSDWVLAALWRLPVVFVCQNNQWGEHTPIAEYAASTDLARRAASYGMSAGRVDGFDPIATWHALCDGMARARSGAGPVFLECVTYRLTGHTGTADYSYVPADELAAALARDPAPTFRKWLDERQLVPKDRLDELDAAAVADVDDAFAFAAGSQEPGPDELLADVFADDEWVRGLPR